MREVVEGILDCAVMPEKWPEALDLFSQSFLFKSSVILAVQTTENVRLDPIYSAYFREGEGQPLRAMFDAGTDGEDVSEIYAAPPHTLFDEASFYEHVHDGTPPPSPFRDLMNDHGLIVRTTAVLNRKGPWIDLFLGQFERDDLYRKTTEDPRLPIMWSLISKTFDLQRLFFVLKRRHEAVLRSLDKLGLGVFLLDGSGRAVLHNAEAQRILDLSDGLALDPQKRLCSTDSDKSRALLAAAREEARTAAGQTGEPITIETLPRPSGLRDYVVAISPLRDAEAELEPGFSCAFLLVIDPDREGALDASVLGQLGGLTEAEAAVLSALVQGSSLDDIAESRNVSIHTVRNQVKQVQFKLRCSSQTEIIRLAATTSVPLFRG